MGRVSNLVPACFFFFRTPPFDGGVDTLLQWVHAKQIIEDVVLELIMDRG